MRLLQGIGPNPAHLSAAPASLLTQKQEASVSMLLTQWMLTLKKNILWLWQKALFKNCQSQNEYSAGYQDGCILDLVGALKPTPLKNVET